MTTTTGAAELPQALRLADELRKMDEAKKYHPSGPGGQMLGCEQYRLIASGFTFECLQSAAAELRRLHAQVEALSAAPQPSPSPAPALKGPWSLGEIDGNWRDIDRKGHGGVIRIVWRMEDDDGRNQALEAQAHAVVVALNAADTSPAPAQPGQEGERVTPTDAALSQLRHLYQNMVSGGVRDTASSKRIAEGLLAPAIEALERGAQPAGEPVYWLHRHPDEPNGELCTYRLTPGDKRAGWIEEPVYTAPPPQAVREPLTDEQIGALSCRDGLANVEVPVIQWLVREVEYLHGITKGGQHGAE